jgi:hypothetical protein
VVFAVVGVVAIASCMILPLVSDNNAHDRIIVVAIVKPTNNNKFPWFLSFIKLKKEYHRFIEFYRI